MNTEASNIPPPLIVMDKFENRTYSIMRVPRVIEMDWSGVYVHRDGPHQDEIKSLENMNWEEEKLLTPKLKGHSYGDYTFLTSAINTKFFETREKLDALYSEEYTNNFPVTNVKRISLEEALKFLTVTISCNTEYYLSNRDEMEKDLGRSLDNMDINNKDLMKKLETELLYNQAIKIFGEDNDGDDNVTAEESGESESVVKSLTFREFRLLFADGNDRIATARRGSYYLLFFYITS